MGMKGARKGPIVGRLRPPPSEKKLAAKALWDGGMAPPAIRAQLGIPRGTLERWLLEWRP